MNNFIIDVVFLSLTLATYGFGLGSVFHSGLTNESFKRSYIAIILMLLYAIIYKTIT